MKLAIGTILFLLFSWCCKANILVIEYTEHLELQPTQHGELVTWVACGNSDQTCNTVYSDFKRIKASDPFYTPFLNLIEKATVVNLSFGFQQKQPVPEYEKEQALSFGNDSFLEVIEEREKQIQEIDLLIKSFNNLFDDNPSQLFVIAADNGYELETMVTSGIAINENNFRKYPAILKQDNTLKVSAYDTLNHKLYDYSNYSLDLVDLASPVGLDQSNNPIMGTSFAAPLVSKTANNLLSAKPNLSIAEVKEILMKSCHIENVQAAIIATEDIIKNQNKSEYYKAMHHPLSKTRKELQQKFNDVMFVRSGGYLVEELAQSCTDYYIESNKSLTIEQACLKAHSEAQILSSQDIKQLPKLWNIRAF